MTWDRAAFNAFNAGVEKARAEYSLRPFSDPRQNRIWWAEQQPRVEPDRTEYWREYRRARRARGLDL